MSIAWTSKLVGWDGENVTRGVRHAAICSTEGCGRREFFGSREEAELWKCQDHHQGVIQENRKYMGMST